MTQNLASNPPGDCYFVTQAGRLQFEGPDKIAFLQRQTSNDMKALTPGKAIVTVLVTAMGRILDVLTVYLRGEKLEALILPGRSKNTFAFLKSRIFFMDKVSIQDVSNIYVQLDLYGPNASQILTHLGIAAPSELYTILGTTHADHQDLDILALPGLGGIFYRLSIPSTGLDTLSATLKKAGASELDEQTYEILRVEAGLASANGELTEEYTPLETGLSESVSSSKGCYTGQEVLARQITYEKVTQRLVGLRLNRPTTVKMRLEAEGKPAGIITSAVISPRFGPIALAVVRRPYFEPGSLLRLETPQGAQTVQVCTLPFS